MTNFEYYKDEILALDEDFAKGSGNFGTCQDIGCEKCEFAKPFQVSCSANKHRWLYAEHIEQPRLTKKERLFCELVETGWIARDADGASAWTAEKPQKDEREKEWCTEGGAFSYIKKEMFGDIFPFIKWTDTEPWAVEDLLKLEVEE